METERWKMRWKRVQEQMRDVYVSVQRHDTRAWAFYRGLPLVDGTWR